jgi:hypothetical protein
MNPDFINNDQLRYFFGATKNEIDALEDAKLMFM